MSVANFSGNLFIFWIALRKSVDCHENLMDFLAMTDFYKIQANLARKYFGDKIGVAKPKRGNKTKVSIDEASGKSPRFIAPNRLQGVSRSKKDNRA